MNDEIQVNWEVEDGYGGKSRPRMTNIYPENFVSEATLQPMLSVFDLVSLNAR